MPPTNRWFSGLVFGDQPQPVFPMPLSFGLTDTGFALGLPRSAPPRKTIMGRINRPCSCRWRRPRAQVSGYDTLTVTVELLDAAGAVLGHRWCWPRARRSSATRRQSTSTSPSSRSSTGAGPARGHRWPGSEYGLVVSRRSDAGRAARSRLPKGGSITLVRGAVGRDRRRLAGHRGGQSGGGWIRELRVDGDACPHHPDLPTTNGGTTAFAHDGRSAAWPTPRPTAPGTYPSDLRHDAGVRGSSADDARAVGRSPAASST